MVDIGKSDNKGRNSPERGKANRAAPASKGPGKGLDRYRATADITLLDGSAIKQGELVDVGPLEGALREEAGQLTSDMDWFVPADSPSFAVASINRAEQDARVARAEGPSKEEVAAKKKIEEDEEADRKAMDKRAKERASDDRAWAESKAKTSKSHSV